MAKWYLEIGWSLIPIIPATKQPAIKWAEFQERKPTLDEVTSWINKGWYLAVVTGDISGILVVDDDRVKHGLNEWGFQSAVVSKTQNNGKHYFFTYDRELHSHSNSTIRVDLKAWHSYCLVPPFNNREWINKPSRENLAKITPLADDTVRLINSDTKHENGESKPIIMSDFIKISEGGRTDSLHKIACSLFTKHSEADALQILLGINQTYTPPLNQKEFEYQVSRAKTFVSNTGKNQSVKPNEAKVPAKPLSLATIGARRIEDRALEKLAAKTGYPELDNLVKGFIPKRFWTITGETNVGKTALACNLAENVRAQGRKVMYVALEPEYRVSDYLASARLQCTFEQLTDADISYDDGLIDVLTLAEVPTYKDLILSLRATSTKYDIVIVDHIGYFCSSSEEKSFLAEQAKTIRELVSLSKELQTCVIVIAHPRKPSQAQKPRILGMYDVSGSASFAQDSTEVIVIHRPPVNTEDPLCVELSNSGLLLVQKTKAGGNGSIRIEFQTNSAKVSTLGQVIHRPTVAIDAPGERESTMFVEEEEIEEPFL